MKLLWYKINENRPRKTPKKANTWVAKHAPDENPPTVTVFGSIDGISGKMFVKPFEMNVVK